MLPNDSNFTQNRNSVVSVSRHQWLTLTLSAIGGALEYYDFVIFVFFSNVIGRLFFPPDVSDWIRQLQTLGIFAAGYAARPVGGLIMAHFGDLSGRKRVFVLSVLMMGLPTLGMGLLPTYAQVGWCGPAALLILRILQGAAIGGEAPGAWIFVSEHLPSRRMGLACGVLTGGLAMGIFLGSAMATAINFCFSSEDVAAYAWRVPFLLGGILGLGAYRIRRTLEETPVFLQMEGAVGLEKTVPLRKLIHFHNRPIFTCIVLTWLLTASVVVVILMTPSIMQISHQFTLVQTLPANLLATALLSASVVIFGMALDRFGSFPILMIGSLVLVASAYALYGFASSPLRLLALSGLAGLSVGVVTAVPYVIVRSFPADVRFTGFALCYNLTYAVSGGVTPIVVTYWSSLTPLAPAHYVAMAASVAIATLAAGGRQALNDRGTSGSHAQ